MIDCESCIANCPHDIPVVQVLSCDWYIPRSETKQQVHVTTFTCEDDSWYTPAWLVKLADRALGYIDLDPCSTEIANRVVKAERYYTKEQNGLALPWVGHVFCNPPSKLYRRGDPEIDKTAKPHLWAAKFLSAWEYGDMTGGILVVKSVLGYKWYEELYEQLWCCHLTERPAFYTPDGAERGAAKKGVTVFYAGVSECCFAEVFAPYGKIVPPTKLLNRMTERYFDE